ncbi:C2 domain [Dillenia turbinata]|uniref:Phospholipase D n=1 Tax=Dillenia turbinata TaxID=194707 RepID=A0AAN8WCX0_9MAGN
MAADSDQTPETVDGEPSDSVGTMFLHGYLDLWILEAKSLPNMDLTTERMRRCFTMFGTCSAPFGKKVKPAGKQSIITSDPYVSVCLAGATIAQTRVIANTENPVWDEHFRVPVAHPAGKLEFQVKDNDILGAQLIGMVAIPVKKLISGETINGWYPIVNHYGNPLKPFPELHISIQFKPVQDNPLYKNGVGCGPEYSGVPNTYFPLRKGGSVTLYQDAHVPDQMLPEIPLDDGKVFQQSKCWEEICHAMLEAHHLIYIIGWSIYHPEGVRVVLLIWDDKTSHDNLFLKTEGVMQTHDEATRKFFKHSSVHCVLSPRYASNKLSIFKQQVCQTALIKLALLISDLSMPLNSPGCRTLFTHHQKCVLLDTQASGNNRKITAFVGGLDLCDGRYDTPEHRLFGDLTVFANDFHNPTFPVTYWHDDTLIKLDRISWILTPSSADNDKNVHVSEENDPENWHVQVFRSIDSGSVMGFPKLVEEAVKKNLVCGKNLKIERSIHTAYVNAIRSAQHFIYIENQYFLGSSYFWPSYKNAGADNLIPMELALKIASKIKANERFCVYIVIPMWPEGVPTSAAVQEILFWQGQTMSMMYRIVAQALEEVGLASVNHPQEYLNFFCLGKREAPSPDSSSQTSTSSENRALIYDIRPCQGMIVDDEYVIIGSANINQRSMDGSRDTEIAMGAYQPNYTWAGRNRHPRGQVYGYRMSLWAEHLGMIEESFSEPESLKCSKKVNKIAQQNWKAFVSEEYNEMCGHLMQYPVQVSRSGKVSSLPDYESFSGRWR